MGSKLIDYVINHVLFQFLGVCSSFVPVFKIDWNTQVLDYIKKKRVCSTVPFFLGGGGGKVLKVRARKSLQRGKSTYHFANHSPPKTLEQRNKGTIFHYFLLLYINLILIYLINSITYTSLTPTPLFKSCRIRKLKTGTRLEQLEQTRPPLPNYRFLPY